MHGMGAPPKTIGRERQYADDPTGPIVCPAMPEKGPVAAIVLDHEESHQESRGWYGERKREPVAEIERRPHQKPERNERDNCDDDLDDAAAIAGLPVGHENLRPGARIRGVCGRMGGVLFVFQSGEPQLLFASIYSICEIPPAWTNAFRNIAATAFKTTSRKATPLAAFSTQFSVTI